MTFKADFSLIGLGKLELEGVQYDPSRYHHNVLQSQNEGRMWGQGVSVCRWEKIKKKAETEGAKGEI